MSAAAMDGFDPLALNYAPTTLPYTEDGLPPLDYSANYLPLDIQDSYSNFESDFRYEIGAIIMYISG